jgi:hypothetical protein
MAGARMRMRSRADLARQRRTRPHGCWDHLIAAPLWPVGIPAEALDLLDLAVEIPMIGTGASLNVAVAGSLVRYRLAGFL